MRPKVSVIVPVYNVEKYLRECVDSILSQTLREIEVILVDDGSPDNCPKIIDEYALRDPRVVPVHQPNGGYGKAVNRGISLARGKYIGIVESDDWVDPTMYEKLFDAATRADADLAKAEFFTFNSKNPPETKNVRWRARHQDLRDAPDGVFCPVEDYPLVFAFHASLWSSLYRADFIKKIPLLETASAAYQDFPFVMEVLAKAKRMVVVKEPLLHYRMEGGQDSSTMRGDTRLMCMADMALAGRHALEKMGTFSRVEVREAFYFHAMLANHGFYQRVPRNCVRAFFLKMRELFLPIKNDPEFTFRYFTENQRKFVQQFLSRERPSLCDRFFLRCRNYLRLNIRRERIIVKIGNFERTFLLKM